MYYYYKSLFIGVFTSNISLPLISPFYPQSNLFHFRNKITLYQNELEFQEESQRNSTLTPLFFPSNLLPGLPIGHRIHLMHQPLWQKAGWRRVKNGPGGANRKYIAQYWARVWAPGWWFHDLIFAFLLVWKVFGYTELCLLGKIRFNSNLRFRPWPAKWVVLPVT